MKKEKPKVYHKSGKHKRKFYHLQVAGLPKVIVGDILGERDKGFMTKEGNWSLEQLNGAQPARFLIFRPFGWKKTIDIRKDRIIKREFKEHVKSNC